MAAFQFDMKGMVDPVLRAQQSTQEALRNFGLGARNTLAARKQRQFEAGQQTERIGSAEDIAAKNRMAAAYQWRGTLAETERANKAMEDIRRLEAEARAAESSEARTRLEAELDYKNRYLDYLMSQGGTGERPEADLTMLATTAYTYGAQKLGGNLVDEATGRWDLRWSKTLTEYNDQRQKLIQRARWYIESYLKSAGYEGQDLMAELERQMMEVETMIPAAPSEEAPDVGRSLVPLGGGKTVEEFSEGLRRAEQVKEEIAPAARAFVNPLAALGYARAGAQMQEGGPTGAATQIDIGEPEQGKTSGYEESVWAELRMLGQSGRLTDTQIAKVEKFATDINKRPRETTNIADIMAFIRDMKEMYGLGAETSAGGL